MSKKHMKRTTLGLGTVALTLGVIGLSAGSVMAYQGDPAVKGPNYSAERHEAMEKTFENKNYDAWKNLMQGKGRVSQVVNKDNFSKFAEAHELIEQGKTAEAQKIRQELGLGLQNGSGQGVGGAGMHRGMNR
jgi:lipopolysaccharide export system protein LptA